MEENIFKSKLKEYAKEMDVVLDEEMLSKFYKYKDVYGTTSIDTNKEYYYMGSGDEVLSTQVVSGYSGTYPTADLVEGKVSSAYLYNENTVNATEKPICTISKNSLSDGWMQEWIRMIKLKPI